MRKTKLICLMLAALLLGGCTFDETMAVMMDEALEQAANEPTVSTKTHIKSYYSYYLQPSVGRRGSTEISNVFVLDDDEFIMNLNVSSVIKNAYYLEVDSKIIPTYSRSKSLVYEVSKECLDVKEHTLSYSVAVYDLKKNTYLVTLETANFTFLAKCPLGSVVQIAAEMLRIARTAEIDEEAILKNFGAQNDETYEKQKVEIIKETIPESGLVEDIMPTSSAREETDSQQSEESDSSEEQVE